MKNIKYYLVFSSIITLLSINSVNAVENYIIPQNNPTFQFNIWSPSDGSMTIEGEVHSSVRNLTDNEKHALFSAGNTWTNVLHLNPNSPVEFTIISSDDLNAAAASEYVDIIGENYRKTNVNAILNNLNYIHDPSLVFPTPGFIEIGAGLVDGHIGWEHFVEPYPIFNSLLPDLYSTIEHEIYHALGLSSGATQTDEDSPYYFTASPTEYLTIWDKYLRVDNGTIEIKPTSGMEIKNSAASTGEFDVYNYSPYFVGPETMKALAGVKDSEVAGMSEDQIIEYCKTKISTAGGLQNYAKNYLDKDRVNGLPINGLEDDNPELSHIELRNSYMSHQDYQNWGILMEAELAALKDIGYTKIQPREYFGKSYYLDNVTDTWTGYNNDGKGYAQWDIAQQKYINTPSQITNGIGLHIYGDNNKITQQANILSQGLATIGVRIDGVGNTYTLDSGYKIETTGRNNIGLAATWGKNHTINIKNGATIDASGENGIALRFDFGKNIVGGYNDDKGSYINYASRSQSDEAVPADLNGALVKDLNIAGNVAGEKAAIYISQNAHVQNINIMQGANIKGDIISDWNSEVGGAYATVQSAVEKTTDINFGVNSSGGADAAFNGTYEGNIDGENRYKFISIITENNTLNMNVKGGNLDYNNANAKVNSVNIDSGASLNGSTQYAIRDKFQINGTYNPTNNAMISSTASGAKIVNSGNINISDNFVLNAPINSLGGVINIGNAAQSGYLNVTQDMYLSSDGSNHLVVNNGGINTMNNSISDISLAKLELNSDTNVALDIDLATQTIDRFKFANSADLVTNGKNINIADVNILNQNIAITQDKFAFKFIDNTLNNQNLAGRVTTSLNKQILSPIYKYNLGYENNGLTEQFVMARSNTGSYRDFNPSVLASSVGAQVGAYFAQLNSYDMAFSNMDMNMLMTQQERTAMKFRNKIATLGTGSNLGTFSPNQMLEENRGSWFRPYTTFEKVGLKNGPNVSNVGYGSFFGVDSDLIKLKKGWEAVYTGYAGYNGSHQAYDGVSIYQNGGQLGATGIFYKGNFFTGLTANVGASNAEAGTMYGQDNFTMLSTGIASKTGYNWELKEGKFIIQPSWLMSYSFVNTFDYTNSAGVRIDSDGLHAIQLVPGLKFIGNLKNGWQPYIGVQMVWNIMDDTKFKANNVDLPQMSVKPYIQYGVGIQKRWGERLTGFFQTMLRNGGRNGIALSLGFRYAIGK